MLVSLNWLNQFVKIDDIDASVLAEKITRSGIEVESVDVLSEATNVVIGHVLTKEPHPKADKLSVCTVDVGNGDIQQIVCGAKNVAADQKVIVAKVGAVLPGNFKIKKAKLRGVESNGMICSLQELGIESKFVPSEYSEGIFVCDKEAPVGENALKYLHLCDTVLELGLTPNRSDCLSMMGVAYEVSAILDRPITFPKINLNENNENTSNRIKIEIESDNCKAYYGKIVENIEIKQSPKWLQTILIASGIRPINNVVDVTNYVMLETGQPLHAFDLDKLNSDRIVVRNAKDKETIVTLDGNKRELLPSDLLITDGSRGIALAGVMGGENTQIDDNSKRILLESAVFDSMSVRRTSTRLGLRSDSSIRFEKKVDPNRTKLAIDRATQLIHTLAGGTPLNGVACVDNSDKIEKEITISTEKIESVLGISIPIEDIKLSFDKLNFSYTCNANEFTVSVPTRRQDIFIQEDLIEEIGRIYGYDHIPLTLPETSSIGSLNHKQYLRRLIKRTLQAEGMTQVINYSLTNIKNIERFLSQKDIKPSPIRLAMPMSEDRAILRHSLLPHIIQNIKYNVARNIDSLAIYELGKKYYEEYNEYHESYLLSGAITGVINETKWQGKKEVADFYALKGVLETVFDKLDIKDNIEYKLASDNIGQDFHPGRTAEVFINDRLIGIIGQVHPQVQKEYDINDTYVFEIELEPLLEYYPEANYKVIPKYPSIIKDMAFIVDNKISSEEIKKTIIESGKKMLKAVEVFDLYVGQGIPEDHKSIAYTLEFRDNERTLTDEEVNNRFNKIIKSVEEKHNVKLRG